MSTLKQMRPSKQGFKVVVTFDINIFPRVLQDLFLFCKANSKKGHGLRVVDLYSCRKHSI